MYEPEPYVERGGFHSSADLQFGGVVESCQLEDRGMVPQGRFERPFPPVERRAGVEPATCWMGTSRTTTVLPTHLERPDGVQPLATPFAGELPCHGIMLGAHGDVVCLAHLRLVMLTSVALHDLHS